MRRRPHPALLALAALLLVALALVLILRGSPGRGGRATEASSAPATSSGFDGAALQPAPAAPGFTLQDQGGRRVSLASYRGRVTVLTFLSASCGASCIVIAQQIRGALDELARPVPVLVVSADPQADTPARVARFLDRVSLVGRVRYLTGPPALLRPLWRAYRITPVSDSRAAFERAATVLLLDGRGRERVVYGLEQLTPEALSHDIGRLGGEPAHP
jgi:protein SCO1/2